MSTAGMWRNGPSMLRDARVADHVGDQEAVERRQRHGAVAQHLDRDAARAEGDHRAEHGVAR